jgi:hypothetical protein
MVQGTAPTTLHFLGRIFGDTTPQQQYPSTGRGQQFDKKSAESKNSGTDQHAKYNRLVMTQSWWCGMGEERGAGGRLRLHALRPSRLPNPNGNVGRGGLCG